MPDAELDPDEVKKLYVSVASISSVIDVVTLVLVPLRKRAGAKVPVPVMLHVGPSMFRERKSAMGLALLPKVPLHTMLPHTVM